MTENDLKVLAEIHAIREQIYEETKNMTIEERMEHTSAEARKFIEEQNMKIIREENINGFKIVDNS